jgi:hypothetical protein
MTVFMTLGVAGIGLICLWFCLRGALCVAISQAFSEVNHGVPPEVLARKDIVKGSVIKADDVEIGYFPNLHDPDTFSSVESVLGKTAPVDIYRGKHLHVSMFIEFENAKNKTRSTMPHAFGSKHN